MNEDLPPDLPEFAPPDAGYGGSVVALKPRRKGPKKVKPNHGGEAWKDRLSVDKQDGGYRSTLANATLILQHDRAWNGVFGYDERSEEPVLLKRPPFGDAGESICRVPRQLKDGDDVRVIQWLEESYGISITLGNVHAAINAVAELYPFDRVREYLDGLAWDGTERLDTWTSTYLGVEASPYSSAVGRRWLISCVARTYEPGCKADHVIVAEGEQGIGKSTALRVLGGDEYFGDDVPPIGSKDAQQYLGALWIVELAEMDAATKAEAATLKRFLTTTSDRYRPPYGRRMIMHGRRCCFAGTVNLQQYLRDSTGGRRFWPLKCGVVELELLQRDRDQLWAEAVAAYRAGEPWHLTADSDVSAAQAEQERRRETDPWQEAIEEFLDRPDRPDRTFVTTAQLLTQAIHMPLDRVTKRESNRVGEVMRGLGWRMGQAPKQPDGKRPRGWRKEWEVQR